MFDPSQVPIAGGLDIPLPPMLRVRQRFDASRVEDIEGAVRREIDRPGIGDRIRPGSSIAIGAGSRGIANLATVVRALVGELRQRGASPFIFPAMGSHGGATQEGQRRVLADYGVTEENVGAPVRATMETVVVGELDGNTPIHVDRYAHEADGIILVNRIKPHTTFRGSIESGIVKMLVIGMGKIQGATVTHAHGMDRFPEVLPAIARITLGRVPFLFGLGLIENAYDQTCHVEAVPPETLIEREMELLAEAKRRMGRLYIEDIDVLVIDRMGKEVSGAGFDPNITGRNSRGVTGFDVPRVNKIVVMDLTEATHGNATGIGLADVVTRRLVERIDHASTWANVITSAYLDGALLPIYMNTEREALALAAKTVPRVRPERARIVRIRDTLSLETIMVSEPLLEEVEAHPGMEALEAPSPIAWDEEGRMPPIEAGGH